MSVPPHASPDAERTTRTAAPHLMRSALWVAIGALILAAVVCVVWVLIGPDNGIIGRAFLTILLLAGFAGAAILDAGLAPRRPSWLVLTSMVVWVVILLDGAFLVWMPLEDAYFGDGFGRFVSFLLVVAVLQLALLHVRLYIGAHRRYATGFTRTIVWITVALLTILAGMLVLALTFHEFIDFAELYWRIVVAITILTAVGTALVPLINALFAPKKPVPSYQPGAAYPGGAYPAPDAGAPAPQPAPANLPPWPTFADGVTPLPVLPDGSPDWNAYYTGYPTYPAQAWPTEAAQTAPAPGAAGPAEGPPPAPVAPPSQPGYQGYPPPPPAPR